MILSTTVDWKDRKIDRQIGRMEQVASRKADGQAVYLVDEKSRRAKEHVDSPDAQQTNDSSSHCPGTKEMNIL